MAPENRQQIAAARLAAQMPCRALSPTAVCASIERVLQPVPRLTQPRPPRVDIARHARALFVRVELPGVGSEGLRVSVADGVLDIWGGVRRDVTCGNFAHRLELPPGIDVAGVAATLCNGLLEVVLPWAESHQRRIVDTE